MGKEMLERLGYTVTVRNTAREALDVFRRRPEAFDLVITDQTMPGMTGAELAAQLLAIRPDLPILLCTGYSATISEDRAKSIGIKAFLMKPLERNALARIIRDVLDEKPSASGEPGAGKTR